MKRKDIELLADFLRWYEREFPDNNTSSEELIDFFLPHIRYYWSKDNLVDDCNCYFAKIMELD